MSTEVLEQLAGELPHVVVLEAAGENDGGVDAAEGALDLPPAVLGVTGGAKAVELALDGVGVAGASVQHHDLDDELLDVGEEVKDVDGRLSCGGLRLGQSQPPGADEVGIDREDRAAVGPHGGEQDAPDGAHELGALGLAASGRGVGVLPEHEVKDGLHVGALAAGLLKELQQQASDHGGGLHVGGRGEVVGIGGIRIGSGVIPAG